MSWGMSKDWPMGAQFWEQLTRTDRLWGERVRAGGCEDCGGPLDRADYPRKPRGGLGAEPGLPRGEPSGPQSRREMDGSAPLGCARRPLASGLPPAVVSGGGRTPESSCHGLSQALQKRGLPRGLMTDGGSAFVAAEMLEGLARLGIVHHQTVPNTPEQNGKQENFWGQVEGRLMPMLEGEKQLTLELLNRATLAWLELEYNRKCHSEIGTTPLERYLAGPSVLRAVRRRTSCGVRFVAKRPAPSGAATARSPSGACVTRYPAPTPPRSPPDGTLGELGPVECGLGRRAHGRGRLATPAPGQAGQRRRQRRVLAVEPRWGPPAKRRRHRAAPARADERSTRHGAAAGVRAARPRPRRGESTLNQKLLSLYGLKFNPFRPDVPAEALYPTPAVDAFVRRVERA